jgi:hypothetical protein
MAGGTSRYQRAGRGNCEPAARTRISPVSSPSSVPGHIRTWLTIKGGSFLRRPAAGAPPGDSAGVSAPVPAHTAPTISPPALHDLMAAVVTQNGQTWKCCGLGDDRAQAVKPA